ncbi:alpha/beta hydrolase family protein [Oceanicella actignis]|uniref:alpha/beta hydrolase family protein n=1 Tax=Oceanicella actignis TaxID=1189325 RepID=UPI00125C1CE4|nr:dienelactone hydrolase [Oceanicella actignis]TYO85237.1 putative dienelactone hydrolase [Oceanicella actignis]
MTINLRAGARAAALGAALAVAQGAAPAAAAEDMTASHDNRIDLIRPDAPELAAPGPFRIGVRTLNVVNPGQLDILNVKDGARPTYDRPLTLEVWYPAADDAPQGGTYDVILRDGERHAIIRGRAARDAAPSDKGPFPVVIVSHGYPGNRYLLGHLAENLATKGYVVVSIDHTDSMYHDKAAFGSTLVNRPLDQKFALDEIARRAAGDGFLAGLADAENAGLVGYSMGAYGAVISAGGGVAQTGIDHAWGAPDGTLAIHKAGSQSHEALIDPRLKAVIAIAPWGWNYGFWDDAGLAGVRKPILYVAGSADDVSGYDPGVKTMFERSTGADRWLLTFQNANHNAAAPMPAPIESWEPSDKIDFPPFEHYADAVWDTVRMNNILQHFATAWFDWRLKGDEGRAAYLDLVPVAAEGVWALDEEGKPKPEHSYWKGFRKRTAVGLELRHLAKGAR